MTSQVEETTAKPKGCAAEIASGDAIMMLVCDMLWTQRPPRYATAWERSARK
jgi:hypothetical protein